MDNDKPMNQYRMSANGLEPLTQEHDRELGGHQGKLGLKDTKKVVILTVLMVVGCAVVAFQFLRGKGPQVAEAGWAVPTTAQLANTNIGEIESVLARLEADPAESKDKSVLHVEQLVEEFDSYIRQRQVPLSQLPANPFQVRPAPQDISTRIAQVEQGEADEEALRCQRLQTASAGLTLGSVLISGGNRLAVVNGKVCREGDRLGAFKVTQIQSDTVALVCDDGTVTLSLFAAQKASP